MKRWMWFVLFAIGLGLLASCRGKKNHDQNSANPLPPIRISLVADNSNPYTVEVIDLWSHDPESFTQGLIYENGFIYEGTGLQGESSLLEIELKTGRIRRRINLESQYFGEGITWFRGKIYQLTWQSQTALVYDAQTMERVDTFYYSGQGWGLTHDDSCLIMSDGTDVIRFMNPQDFKLIRHLKVIFRDNPILNINELEWIKGEIWANIWMSNWIARIDPASGQVNSWVDLSELYTYLDPGQSVDVLNGIAYDQTGDRILVTGKYWPKLFSIRLKSPVNQPVQNQ